MNNKTEDYNKEELLKFHHEMQDIFDNLPFSILYKDDKNNILRANKLAAKTTGYDDPKDLENKSCWELYPDEADKYYKDDLEIIETGQPKLGFIEKYTPEKGPHGWIKVDKIPYFDPIADRQVILAIIQDITAQYRTQEELKRANAELEEFAYRTSHDLRSPVVSSIRLLDIIEGALNQNDKEKALQGIAHARDSLQKLETLINDLLDLTQVKKQETELQDINLAETINSNIKQIEHLKNFKRIQLSIDIDEQNKVIKTDKILINHIIGNLLSNAVKYHNYNQATSYVRVNCQSDNQHIILSVRDNGLGIPEKYRDSVFGMFKRFHTKVDQGSGLGLYLVKKSVEMLDGSIDYIAHDHGSEFIIKLDKA